MGGGVSNGRLSQVVLEICPCLLSNPDLEGKAQDEIETSDGKVPAGLYGEVCNHHDWSIITICTSGQLSQPQVDNFHNPKVNYDNFLLSAAKPRQ